MLNFARWKKNIRQRVQSPEFEPFGSDSFFYFKMFVNMFGVKICGKYCGVLLPFA